MLKAGYICKRCGLDVFDVDVRDRVENEGVQNYVHHIGRVCGENHSIRSPLCPTQTLDLKLPITKKGIGFDGPPLTDEDHLDIQRQLAKPPGAA
jgi:hypothetical protein